MRKKYLLYFAFFLTLLGLVDSVYLTLEHYGKIFIPCREGIFVDCGRVLKSKYSEFFGIPLAFLGVIHYGFFTLVNFYNVLRYTFLIRVFTVLISSVGAIFSLVFIYLQLFIIGSVCLYCMFSALVSFILFGLIFSLFQKEKKFLFVKISSLIYKIFLKRIFFIFDSEFIHENFLLLGYEIGNVSFLTKKLSYFYSYLDPYLRQKTLGIEFKSPIGLAAGFDYKAYLTQILPSLSFGFMTIGTITNMPYEGNPPPRLGRLPKSKSLLVNKGFKNEGVDVIKMRLINKKFDIPVGISIGITNSSNLTSQKKSIRDIINAFEKIENEKICNSYYELNISCPNLIHQSSVIFDKPQELDMLLANIDELKIKKPIFIKMPIDKSDEQTLSLLKVISKHLTAGVVFGNLEKDRSNPSLYPDEVAKFKQGYYSGKPTFERSNQLIEITYKNYKDRFIIIGCGGVFSPEDAYKKVKLGATLVQLITGLIYNGPQLVSEINFGLVNLLRRDGFKNISEAIGVDVK